MIFLVSVTWKDTRGQIRRVRWIFQHWYFVCLAENRFTERIVMMQNPLGRPNIWSFPTNALP